MNSREQEKAWEALTVLLCPVLGIGAVLGMLVAVAETRLPWLALIVRVVFWGALGIGLAVSIWFEGRRFEREHGGRVCGAKSEGDGESAISGVSLGSAISEKGWEGANDEIKAFEIVCVKCGKRAISALGGPVCAECVKPINGETPC